MFLTESYIMTRYIMYNNVSESAENTTGNPEAITSQDAEDTSDSFKPQPPESKRFLNENFKENDKALNQRPRYFAPQGQMMNQPTVYLGSTSLNPQLASNNEHFNSLLHQNQNYPQRYQGRDRVPGQNEYEYTPTPNDDNEEQKDIEASKF